ncbi:spore coat protein SP60-like [Amphibalanus amphitrite]|uniref:spore coat protein SP60-like n=1 Tax=Amphibalanus amphitrite TaxID=1232801 RepID=UPI001C909CB8|nr:spore coat protein SP60-like [Amphibalanus amphitrite]XP_043236371.1 spore coat protein SP60-like [Amphibalanus amphitrite]
MLRLTVLCVLVACASAQARKSRPSFTLNQPPAGQCSKQCPERTECEIQQCEVCVPKIPTCKEHKCEENERCEDRPTGPVCIRLSCADIKCAAGELCNDLPDGPDCVPDVPSCEGFFCRRGTNCYIRNGSPICLPNTCAVRECKHGLTCIDTKSGALCRTGQKRPGCEGKYCPPNSKCVETEDRGPVCDHI